MGAAIPMWKPTMDIVREKHSAKIRRRRIIYAATAVITIPLIFLGLGQLEPAAPTVERGTIWIDTVKRGTMLRQVRGLGTLVPEEIWWIPATNDARVQRILVQPGTEVSAETVLMELSNPQLEQEAVEAEWQLKAEIAQYRNLEIGLESQRLEREAILATMRSENEQAGLRSEADQLLNTKGLNTKIEARGAQSRAEEISARYEIEKKRLSIHGQSTKAQLAVQSSRIEQLRALASLKRGRVEALQVRAGIDGVVQQLPVQVGQQVTVGVTLAMVAQASRLKAQLRVPEIQAKDVQVGQEVNVDTRNGIVSGRVTRIDPAVQNGTVTVDVAITGELPKGVRPDLTIDGTIELERLPNVLYISRPTQGQGEGPVGLFRLSADGREAERVQVQLGRASVNTVEITSGLREGDKVILSDMSAWDGFEKLEFK